MEESDNCLRILRQEIQELRSSFVGQRNESRAGHVALEVSRMGYMG